MVFNGKQKHFYAVSNDYGLTWTNCRAVNEMDAYNTTPALFRVSWTPNFVMAAWINRSGGLDSYERRPLVVAYSVDDCNSWKDIQIIDDGSYGGVLNSMNEPTLFSLEGKAVLLGYRRYADGNMTIVPPESDAVLRIFNLTIFDVFRAFQSMSDAFFTVDPMNDLNNDGIVNILDAILLGLENDFTH